MGSAEVILIIVAAMLVTVFWAKRRIHRASGKGETGWFGGDTGSDSDFSSWHRSSRSHGDSGHHGGHDGGGFDGGSHH